MEAEDFNPLKARAACGGRGGSALAPGKGMGLSNPGGTRCPEGTLGQHSAML